MEKKFIDIKKENKKIKENNAKVIFDAESKYRGQLYKLAKSFLKKGKNYKVLLLAGPSCAGKTTTSGILSEIFKKQGKNVLVVCMDDFFLPRVDTPFLPNGMRDYDSLRAINIKLLKNCFSKLIKTGSATLPRFDFVLGESIVADRKVCITNETIIIFEGIHVLNPEIIKCLSTKNYFKTYITTRTGFECDAYRKIGTRQLRMIRRIVRDVDKRGRSVDDILKTWANVTEAEDTYISPYKHNVDFVVDTTHSFELALFKNNFFEIFIKNREVMQNLSFLPYFEESTSLSESLIPSTSLMWEFIEKK